MGASAADPDHLDAYVAAARDLNEVLRHRLGSLVDAYDRVVPRLRWGVFDARATLGGLASYIDLNDADDEWVAAIAARFRAADDGGGGPVVVDDALIDGALRAAGVGAGSRTDLTVDDPIMAGAPPTSGYADDPVCTATGHFVEREVDLVVPSRVSITGWARTYTSRWMEPGPFGRGWASWASVRVEALASGAAVVLPDGRRAVFVGDGSGGHARVTGLFADLVAGEEGWQLRWFDRDRWSFDADGRLTSVASPDRGAAAFHGEPGRLERISHAGGRWVSLEWSGARVAAVRSSDGRVVRYRYDGAGDLVEVDGSGSGRRRYEVQDGLVAAVIDADGVELVRNAYDPDGRVRWQRSPFGRRTTFRYPARGVTVVSDAGGGPSVTHLHDPAGRLVGVVDDHGAWITKFYDRWGNPTASADRTGAVVSQVWDERSRLLRREEPDGAVTAFVWDEQDRIVARTDAGGETVRLAYRGEDRAPSRVVDRSGAVTRVDVVDGQVVGVTDPDGVVTRFERNGDGLVTAVVDGLGGRTEFGYDAGGALVRVGTPEGGAVQFARDAAGRVVERVDADGTAVSFEWTGAGRLAAATTATGARSVFGYGDHGEVVTVEDAGGAVSRVEWDGLGRLVALTNPAGTTVRHRYDGLGRLVSTYDGCGAELRREHDAEGRVTALVDGEGRLVRREHDAVGRLVAEIDGDGGVTRFDHDRCGRVVSVTDPSGGTTTQARDPSGRVVAVTGPDGATTRYRWTPGGRLRSVTTADGVVTRYGYDRAGRLASVHGPGGGRRTYERDAAGRVVGVTTGSGARTSFELDGCGRVVARTDACGDVTRWTHHPSGRVASVEAPGGGTSRFGWDPAGRLVSAVDANGAETTYRWDAAGFLSGVTDPLGGVQVHHNDPMGRMVAWTDQLGRRTDLHIDRAGRLTGHRDPSGRAVDLRSLPGARINARGRSAHRDQSVVRDAVGRIVQRDGVRYRYRHGKVVAQDGPLGRRTFTYDLAGQLIACRDTDGRAWSWLYDACGRRVEQVSPEGTDRYRYDAGGRLLEVVRHGPRPAVTVYRYDAAGRRTHEIHGELGRLRSTRYRWDELGRLCEVHRREGRAPDRVTRIRCDDAGALESVDGDLGGLVWLHFRTLDLATGTFLSPDPLPGAPGTPVVANPYHYAANDPVGLRDPFGLAPMTDADLEAMREAAGRPVWQKAYDSAQDLVDDPISWAADHWETVAAAGLVVVGGVLVATGVGAPIGAGLLVGASMAFSSQVALTGEVDQRSLLVSTAAGAVGGGIGGATSGLAVTSQVAIGAGTDMALSAGAQYATTGTVDPQQVLWDGVIGAGTAGVGATLPWAPEPIPLGFRRAEFAAFRAEFRLGLVEAGYGDALPAIRGSSMTGIRHRTGLPLDELGPDDFDLAVVGDRIFEDAKAIGMKPRDGRRRTGPMRGQHVEALGLAELQDRLSALAPRKVSLMAYRDLDVLAERGPLQVVVVNLDVAYVLEALVFPATMPWPSPLHGLRLVGLAGSPELVMLPLTSPVQEHMGRAPDDEPVLGFLELVDPVRQFAAELSASGPVVYLHAEITGGTGTQGSVGWRGGQIDFGPVLTANIAADLETDEYVLAEDVTQGAINRALRHLGVRAAATALDEFDSVGLGLHRDTDEWISDRDR